MNYRYHFFPAWVNAEGIDPKRGLEFGIVTIVFVTQESVRSPDNSFIKFFTKHCCKL